VKIAIPLALLLLVGAVATLHRAWPSPAAGLERRAVLIVTREGPEAPAGSMAATPSPVLPVPAVLEPQRPAAAGSDRKAVAGSLARMTSLLDRELSLTALQREVVEQLLKDRESEIKACHAAIVRSGVIDLAHYEWQVSLMKEGWYCKMDALLDRAQHQRFLVLVNQGFFNEGLAFTVEPGMTVLD